ncbi:MAG TPA: hypothetical protein PJ982_04525 [Lacipirellulaceae bacterium]|nr:hypothetical protein [Lacipirellulaceae bacterium]
MRMAISCSCALCVAAVLHCGEARAQALGCLALPSTVPQYLGYGYGAGHHAPIVRTPSQLPHRGVRRVKLPACYGPLAPLEPMPTACGQGGCFDPYGMGPWAAQTPVHPTASPSPASGSPALVSPHGAVQHAMRPPALHP